MWKTGIAVIEWKEGGNSWKLHGHNIFKFSWINRRSPFRTSEVKNIPGERVCKGIDAVFIKPVFFFFFSLKPFKVLATETISHKALDADIYSAIPTEKVDGTCCYVTTYKGKIKLYYKYLLLLITLQTISEMGHLLS